MTYNLKSFAFGIVAFVGAFLVMFVFPDFEYNSIVGIVSTVGGFLGISNFRSKFDKAVAFFKTKTMTGALITAVPMVIFALSGFFHFNLPPWLIEALKVLVELGGGWILLGSSHVLTKIAVKNE